MLLAPVSSALLIPHQGNLPVLLLQGPDAYAPEINTLTSSSIGGKCKVALKRMKWLYTCQYPNIFCTLRRSGARTALSASVCEHK